ncbi:hypothetical protein KK062_10710 [Fulvivirgaceae bacterium PWU5]|uniref:Uncharacterized protein n=2 Tax=Cytophagia TaxID=768503 RepID=A0AAP2DWH1_9BACT|nr:hypothetical protein [Dawidia cretensis]
MAGMSGTETIVTLRPDGKKGVVMLKHHYDEICTFVLSVLDTEEETFTLHALLERAQSGLSDMIDSDVSWYVLQVKLDLEAQGLIKVVTPPYKKRLFLLKLTRQGARQLRNQKALSELRED